jgi:hypothetical protein
MSIASSAPFRTARAAATAIQDDSAILMALRPVYAIGDLQAGVITGSIRITHIMRSSATCPSG